MSQVHSFYSRVHWQGFKIADDTPLPLPNDKIMDLLKLCLESTFFQYNGRHYKQQHGTAMGSPVSVVVAEIVMQHIEKRALATYDQTLHFWVPLRRRYYNYFTN